MLIDAILKLHAKIMDEPWAPSARRGARGAGHKTELSVVGQVAKK
jgi:hypothetical protein